MRGHRVEAARLILSLGVLNQRPAASAALVRRGIGRACFVVRDHNVQALAYVYFEDEPGRRLAKRKAAELATLKMGWNK
jgi:hypothetical protein